MLSRIHKRILQGPSMIIEEKHFPHIFEAVQLNQLGKNLQSVKVTLNRAYLDRLEQFLKDLEVAERNLFALDPGTSCTKIQQMVSYPLARKALTYILEEGVYTFVEIVEDHTIDALKYQLQSQEKLKSDDNIVKEDYNELEKKVFAKLFDAIDPIPPHQYLNLSCSCVFTKRHVGPGFGGEESKQENHSLPPSIENGAPTGWGYRSAYPHMSQETPNSKGREFERVPDTVENVNSELLN